MRGLRLHYRIVIPFALVALIGTAAAALLALSVTADALQTRLQSQLLSAAHVVSRGDFALSPAILKNLQEVLGAHIVTFDERGTVLATTIPDDRPELLAAARGAVTTGEVRTYETPPVLRLDCGIPCLVATRRVAGRPGTVVALVAETAELATATRAVARGLLLAGAASLVAIIFVSQAVVRRVTRPIDELVRFVRELSPNERGRRSRVGQNEIGVLAQSFNDLLGRLEQSQDALLRSEKLALAGLIAARVAHDIRNPMSSIKMQTQLVHARLRGDDRAALADVLHDVEQVESVISDLLELARPGQLRLEPVSVNMVVEDALRHVAAQFTHRRIVVDRRLDPALPPTALDEVRFKRALLNLLVNASDAMPTGGTLTITSRQSETSAVELAICDDGVGMDAATLARAFDPFVSTKRDGVGLGLVNAKAVVEAHGGRIRLEPRSPRGICATIWLPVLDGPPNP